MLQSYQSSEVNIFFTSDLHFSHSNILEFCKESRPVNTIKEHDDLLISNWNDSVNDDDIVMCLGDMFFGSQSVAHTILPELKGKKVLIYGNHDLKIRNDRSLQAHFIGLHDYYECKIDGIHVVMFHYPIFEHNKMFSGAFHLHGHTHGKVSLPGRTMDVGIDSRPNSDMRLWRWDEVYNNLITKEYQRGSK